MYRDMELEWRTLQALELRDKNKMLTNIETFQPNDLVYLLAPYSSSLQSNHKSLGKIILAHWPVIQNWMILITC